MSILCSFRIIESLNGIQEFHKCFTIKRETKKKEQKALYLNLIPPFREPENYLHRIIV